MKFAVLIMMIFTLGFSAARMVQKTETDKIIYDNNTSVLSSDNNQSK